MILANNNILRTETDTEIIANLLRKGWAEIQPAPEYNSATQHPPEWNGTEWIVRDLTAQEIIDRLPPYYEASTGIKLATGEQDQNAFSRLVNLVEISQMEPGAMLVIKDAAGEKHQLTVSQFRDLMKEYGAYCYTLHEGS